MVEFHGISLKGLVSSVCVNSKEKAAVLELLKSLYKDVHTTLEVEDTKKIKGIKGVNKAYEIRKGKVRIFYMTKGNDIHIIHACRKQKNKTEKTDLAVVETRFKNLVKNI